MPIIKDPKMNPTEKKFGIIEVDGILCCYTKEGKKNPKRNMPFGFEINVIPDNIIPLKAGINVFYNGQRIEYRCKIKKKDVTDAAGNQAPVTDAIYTFLSNLKSWPTGPGYISELTDVADDPDADLQDK